jgi:hypothetical protein
MARLRLYLIEIRKSFGRQAAEPPRERFTVSLQNVAILAGCLER